MRTDLVIKETDQEVHFIPNLLKPEQIEVLAKSTIQSRKTANLSTMPIGLLDTFSLEEIFDLLAYIQSEGEITSADGVPE